MIEKSPQNFFSRSACILLIIIAFTLMYQPWKLSLREFHGNEGFFATNAKEFNLGEYPVTTAHDVKVLNGYFLYPYLCRLLHDKFDLNWEEATRYTSLFWAFAIAVSVGITVGLFRSFKAGLMSFSCFLGVNFVFEKAVLSNPTFMAVFFVFLAHVLWLYLGFVKTKWNTAWIVSLFFLSIAFLCNGFISLIYFAVPLIFMHRPLRVFSKLSKGGFFAGGVFLIAVILFWLSPYLNNINNGGINYSIFHAQKLGEWLWHVVYTPFEMIVRLLPWSLIAWLPFCVALRPLDETPVISHYFRVLFFVEYIIALINPLGNIICIAYAIAPLAVLCGLSYDIGVRRYSNEIRKLMLICSYIVAGLAISVIVYCLYPSSLMKNDLPTFCLGLLFIGQAFWIYYYRRSGQIWLILLSVSCSVGLFYYATMYRYRIVHRDRSALALKVNESLSRENQEISQLYMVNIGGFYNEGSYIDCPIVKIDSLQELPKEIEHIYLLSPNFPQHSERIWTNLLRENYQDSAISLWRGDLPPKSELINRDFGSNNRESK